MVKYIKKILHIFSPASLGDIDIVVVCCSVAQSCLTFCNPMTALRQASLSISVSPRVCSNSCPLSQWCHPTISSSVIPFSSCLQSFPTSGAFPISQFSHQVAKVLKFQLQHQSFQWIIRIEFQKDWLDWSPCCPRESQASSLAPQFKSFSSSMLCLLHCPTLMSMRDYWKNHSFGYMDFCHQSAVSVF